MFLENFNLIASLKLLSNLLLNSNEQTTKYILKITLRIFRRLDHQDLKLIARNVLVVEIKLKLFNYLFNRNHFMIKNYDFLL